jgi:hypothetical protein
LFILLFYYCYPKPYDIPEDYNLECKRILLPFWSYLLLLLYPIYASKYSNNDLLNWFLSYIPVLAMVLNNKFYILFMCEDEN